MHRSSPGVFALVSGEVTGLLVCIHNALEASATRSGTSFSENRGGERLIEGVLVLGFDSEGRVSVKIGEGARDGVAGSSEGVMAGEGSKARPGGRWKSVVGGVV
jgi:hypothetical protein